jgi:hypothetical protein
MDIVTDVLWLAKVLIMIVLAWTWIVLATWQEELSGGHKGMQYGSVHRFQAGTTE